MSHRIHFVVCFVFCISLSSCSIIQKIDTIEEVKAGLYCIEYQEGMEWNAIFRGLGEPDIHPMPQPGNDLSVNSRGYRGKTLLFLTKRREVKEGDKVRFREIVTKVEFCRKK